MIIIDKVSTCGWEPAIRGMRNPKNSWDRSDSDWEFVEDPNTINPNDEVKFVIGPNDLELANALANGGPVHAKYRRMIDVYLDIIAPLYWWKEFDTYKVGTVANSCSTMHTLHKRDLTLDDFATDQLTPCNKNLLEMVIRNINEARREYIAAPDAASAKQYWYQMVQLLPSSFLQKRTVKLNYEVLHNIYHSPRYNHKLYEWRVFCEWIATLPYATGLIIDPNNTDFKC